MLIVKNFYSLIVLPCVVILLVFGGQVWAQTSKPNILVIWGDDIGWENVSAYRTGLGLARHRDVPVPEMMSQAITRSAVDWLGMDLDGEGVSTMDNHYLLNRRLTSHRSCTWC
jgi:hypothetical protein